MPKNTKLILISNSPRKKLLLKSICKIPFKTASIDCKEIRPGHIKDIENITKINAITKILTYIEKKEIKENQIFIASDTLVCVPDKKIILGKIKTDKKIFKKLAKEQLIFLLGKKQVIYSAVILFDLRNNTFYTDYEKTTLIFNDKSKKTEEIIDFYINLQNGRGPLGKAGCYGLQEPEILMLTKEVIGDPGVVIGLPIYTTFDLLTKCGLKKSLKKANIKNIYEYIWGSNVWKKQLYYIPDDLKNDKNIAKGNFVPMAFRKIK